MMDTDFSATLMPPPGTPSGAVTTLHSCGAEQRPSSGVNAPSAAAAGATADVFTVTTQKGMKALIAQGWRLIQVTPATGKGNQGW
jgi:hypothetical protein